MIKVIALMGLSGVGKSTILNEIHAEMTFEHVQASQLIKEEFARRSLIRPTSEQLRLGNVVENQELLVSAFFTATANSSGMVIFDGHLLIDGKQGVVEIPPKVFAEIGICKLVYLYAAPEIISLRRRQDMSRERPHRELAELAAQQQREIQLAAQLATEMKIPLLLCNEAHQGDLSAFLKN